MRPSVAAGLALLMWAGAILVPLWRIGHAPPPLFDGRMDGASREATTALPPRRGRYELEVAPAGPMPGRGAGAWRLQVAVGATVLSIAGSGDGKAERMPLVLERDRPARLSFTFIPARLHVRVRPAPLPRTAATAAVLVAIALAALADARAPRSRMRGLLAAAMSASGVFLWLLAQDLGGGGWRPMFGAALLALVIGGLFGGSLGLAVARQWPLRVPWVAWKRSPEARRLRSGPNA